jgi:hypothetical protein
MNAMLGRKATKASAPGGEQAPPVAEVVAQVQALSRRLLGKDNTDASVDTFLAQRRRDAAGE